MEVGCIVEFLHKIGLFTRRHRFMTAVAAAFILSSLLTGFIALPLYRKWLLANFLTAVVPLHMRLIDLIGEQVLLFLLWFWFLYEHGRAGGMLYAFFLLLELAPAVVCRAPSGMFEFASLCLFPALWTQVGCMTVRSRRRWMRILLAVITGSGIAQYVVYLAYVIRYGRRLGAMTLMTLLGTNLTEAKFFISDQFGIFPTLCGIVAVFFFCAGLKKFLGRCRRGNAWVGWGAFVFFVMLSLSLRAQAPAYRSLFFDFQKGYRQYQAALNSLKLAKSDPARDISALQVNKKEKGEFYVVVVGESASRMHMNCYGYRRPTTPWMSSAAAQKNLILFRHAFSCMVHTEPAVTLALSRFNNYAPMLDCRPYVSSERMLDEIMRNFSVFEILNVAGFKTHWFSNQEKIGAYNNLISAMAHSVDETEFIEDLPVPDPLVGHQDGELLPLLERTLERTGEGENHVVFLHFRGSHWSYPKDAPSGWPHLPETHHLFPAGTDPEAAMEIISRRDAYDRSLTYTDAVLNRITRLLKNSGIPVTAMFYFSDHGEDVDGVGHNFDAFKPVMAKIPAAFWFSDAYRERYPVTVKNVRSNSRKIYTSDLNFDFILGMTHVDYKGHLPEHDFTDRDYNITSAGARFWQGRLLARMVPGLEDGEWPDKESATGK